MPKLVQIAPEVPVADLARSLKYYQEQLGFDLVMEMPAGDYAVVERDDVAIHLFHDGSKSYTPVGLHVFTAEIDELHAELKSRGAHISQDIVLKPWGHRDFRVKDLSQNELKFTELLESE